MKQLAVKTIFKINLMYHINGQNLTRISKAVNYSPALVSRHLFSSRQAFADAAKHWVESGQL